MDSVTHFLRQHLHDIAVAIIATLLVIFGSDINRSIKGLVKRNHFVVRLTVFVLVCALGYGLATVFLADLLVSLLRSIPGRFLAVWIVLLFVLLGLVAERRRQI